MRSFLQLGTNDRKESISLAVDVATNLMRRKSITPKFTIDELRDCITTFKCGSRVQSRRFHQLDCDFMWTGLTVSLKVPVIHLHVFPTDVRIPLARCKLISAITLKLLILVFVLLIRC